MYSLYLLSIRITPGGVDKLPLIAIEVKNQQNQLNQQENKRTRTKHIVEGERSLWRVLGCQKKLRYIKKSREKDYVRQKMEKHEDEGFR